MGVTLVTLFFSGNGYFDRYRSLKTAYIIGNSVWGGVLMVHLKRYPPNDRVLYYTTNQALSITVMIVKNNRQITVI